MMAAHGGDGLGEKKVKGRVKKFVESMLNLPCLDELSLPIQF